MRASSTSTTTRAEKLPGVVAVLVGKELPIPFGILPVSQDEHTLCIDKVRFTGDPVAAVAAVDEETAEAALDHIDVEYEVLPAIMSIEDALAEDAPPIHTDERGRIEGNVQKAVSLQFGDLDEGFAEADHIREDTYFFEGNTHLPLEQHAAIASYGADGKLTVWSSTQTPHYVHRAMSKVLSLPPSRVRIIACPNGGGFGGKSDPFNHEMAVAKLSMKTRRPVKITLTREEVFYCHRGRHPVKMWVKTGVKKDGSITAMHFRSFLDGGAYGSYGVASLYYTGALQTVTYEIPRYKFEGLRAFTNKPPCGPKRGHGTVQPRFAIECHLDKIAEDIGKNPLDIRLEKVIEPFSSTANQLKVRTVGLRECLERVAERSDFRSKHGKLPRGRGIGIAASSYLTGAGLPIYWNKLPHSGVQLQLDRGGGVTVFCGSHGHRSRVGLRPRLRHRRGARGGRRGRPRRFRGYDAHTRRPWQLLVPRHAHDRARRDASGPSPQAASRRRRRRQARGSRGAPHDGRLAWFSTASIRTWA